MIAVLVLSMLASELRSTPALGQAEGRCRADERGPAFLVEIAGLKDTRGQVKLELYPANNRDFLANDNALIAAGKAFARTVAEPSTGPLALCIRAPRPGRYALSVLHDRDGNRRFTLATDGIGFSANPRLRAAKPKADMVAVTVGDTPVQLRIVMNYRTGLLGFGPLRP